MPPGWNHAIFLSAIIVLTCGVRAQQRIDFDEGVETNGVTWTFQRDSIARDMDGHLVDAGVERFAPAMSLAGAPSGLTAFGPIGSIRPFTAGYDADGVTPILVVRNGVDATLDIHVGRDTAYIAYELADESRTYRFPYIDPNEENEANLIKDQTGRDGGTPAQPGWAFDPKGAQVHSGLIMVQCDLRRDHDNWDVTAPRTRRTALVWTTVHRLQTTTDPWIVAAVSGPVHPDSGRSGQTWSINAFPLSHDEVAVCVSSYETSVRHGGHTYIAIFRRDGEWTLSACTLMDQSFAKEHYHCAGVIRHPDGRLSVLISIGDGIEVNRLVARTKGPSDAWGANDPWPLSGINGEFQISLAGEHWTPTTTVWGDDDPEGPRRHNQFVDVVAADAELSALICSADENHPVIKRLEYDPDTLACTWTTLYMPSVSSWPSERPVSLSLEGLPGGPYAARLGAQNWAGEGYPESRVLFSPDGVRWSQCLAPNERAQTPVAIADGRIWLGHVGSTGRLRRFDIPAFRTMRPIELASSGDNAIHEDMALPTGAAGVQVEKLDSAADLPSEVPPPPCSDANLFVITGTQQTGTYGTWRPVGTEPVLPRPTKSVLVRYWVYGPGPDDVTFLERSTITLWSRLRATDGTDNTIDSGRINVDPGVWTPVTIWFTPEMFGDDLAVAWSFEMQLFANAFTPAPSPSEFFLAWDGVFIDRDTIDGHGAAPADEGVSEIGRASGWSAGDSYTVIGYGAVPMSSWDNRMGGADDLNRFEHTLMRFIDDDTGHTMDVRAIPSVGGFGLTASTDEGDVSTTQTDTVFWLRESPVLLAVVCDGTDTRVHASVGGSPIHTAQLSNVALPFDALEIGHAPMRWATIQAIDEALPAEAVHETLRTLDDLVDCAADLNGDGTLDILDFVAFQIAFVAGDPAADCDGNGSFNVLDFICFQLLFLDGCA